MARPAQLGAPGRRAGYAGRRWLIMAVIGHPELHRQ